VAPIIVIILIAALVVALLMVFIWWRRRNNYHIYVDTTDPNKEVPYYSTVQQSSIQNDHYDGPSEKGSNSDVDRKPYNGVCCMFLTKERRKRRENAELQCSSEMKVRSQEQTLSLINADYENKMKN